jgi:Ca2+-binding RTX toxin-like protein
VGGSLSFSGGNATDTVINTGRMVGDVSLSGGDDLYDGRDGTVKGVIHGSAGNDTLLGGSSNEIFDGGPGGDVISGGAGLDIAAYIDILGGLTASLADPSINTGAAAGDEYDGIEGLVGSASNDVLFGDAGANPLDGRGGADTMAGGAGNDTYFVNLVDDTIVEAAGGGTDTVFSISGFNLASNGANVEVLKLRGTANLSAAGNALNNTIVGHAGANSLNGVAGSDTLVGGQGDDTFRFTTALGTIDRIADFTVADDTIALENAIFTGLAVGTLPAAAFRIGAAAADADDRITYNSATGALIFDSNGNAAGGAQQFAALATGLALTNADFVVI